MTGILEWVARKTAQDPEWHARYRAAKYQRRVERLRSLKATPEADAAFLDLVTQGPGCWEWNGPLNRDGYGTIRPSIYGQQFAHRYGWVRSNGPITDGLWVLHHCDNRRCVRPDHLFLGTQSDNTLDMVAKGRNSKRPLPAEVQPRGERHGMAKLTAADVVVIRRDVAAGFTTAEVARSFGVARETVRRIVDRTNWSHVA